MLGAKAPLLAMMAGFRFDGSESAATVRRPPRFGVWAHICGSDLVRDGICAHGIAEPKKGTHTIIACHHNTLQGDTGDVTRRFPFLLGSKDTENTDPEESSRAAKEAIDELKTPLYAMKPDASALGIESEGSFQIGLGLASKRRYHEIGSYAYGSLWLMPPPPLSRAELEAKARGVASDPKKPEPKKPEPKKPEPKPKK